MHRVQSMMEAVLRFFVRNSRLNYFLFVLVVLAGVAAYIKTPKEIFPSFDLNMVSVSGQYSGASIDMLDTMAVHPIENEIKNIDGVTRMTTVINPGRFTIILELAKRVDKYNTANRIKDAVSVARKSFPGDMDLPTVNVLQVRRDLMRVSLSSKEHARSELIAAANVLKDRIMAIKNISEVTIYGDSDMYYEIQLDSEKMRALRLDVAAVTAALSGLA